MFSTLNGLATIPADGSAAPKPIPALVGVVPSHDAKLIAYSKVQFSPDYKMLIANADSTSERLLTPNLGGCFRPVFNQAGDHLYFLCEELSDSRTGVPKFRSWKVSIDGVKVHMQTDSHLFDKSGGAQAASKLSGTNVAARTTSCGTQLMSPRTSESIRRLLLRQSTISTLPSIDSR